MSEIEEIVDDDEVDEIAEFVKTERITAQCTRVDCRPDVTDEEQLLWRKQDPDFPPEHYHCKLHIKDGVVELYQTVGADYPDEEEDAEAGDLYRFNRELMLSPEFLVETAALKANSVDEAETLDDWIVQAFCVTATPRETYEDFQRIRDELKELLGDSYHVLVQLALAAELERDEESEEWT